jgi:hypothetical protein
MRAAGPNLGTTSMGPRLRGLVSGKRREEEAVLLLTKQHLLLNMTIKQEGRR